MDKKHFIRLFIGFLIIAITLVVAVIIGAKNNFITVKTTAGGGNLGLIAKTTTGGGNFDIFGVLFLCLALVVAVFIISLMVAIGSFVYNDAKKRGMPPLLWALIAVFVPYFVGLIIYLIVRKPVIETCPECGAQIESSEDIVFCPKCGFQLKNICPNCKSPVLKDVRFCPHCGYKLNEKNNE